MDMINLKNPLQLYGIYHKDCPDGSAAAAVLKLRFPKIKLSAVSHEELHDRVLRLRPKDEVIFADICPLAEDLAALGRRGISYWVIDHHVSCNEEIKNYEKQNNTIIENVFYEPDKSGCTAVWHFLYKDRPLPQLLKYIEIGDLWKWERDKNSKFISQFIELSTEQNKPDTFISFMRIFNYRDAVSKGKTLYKQFQKEIQEIASNAHHISIGGEKHLAVNSSEYAKSTIANNLARRSKHGIGIVYTLHPEKNLVKFSVRGTPKSANRARKLAESFGGGGHDKASGFTMSLEKFFSIIIKKKY